MVAMKRSLLVVAGLCFLAGSYTGVAMADAGLPSLNSSDLAQGPFSYMHMLLQKTLLKINVATIEVRVDKPTQARLAELARGQVYSEGLARQLANVVTHSTLTVTPLDQSLGGLTLTRNGRPATDVTLTLPLPLLARAGARYRRLAGDREVFDVELDLEYVTWSRVKRFSIETNGMQANYAGQVVNLNRIDI